ncbi:MAG: type II CRISPR RNA-guided endonuclease Cas9 [Rickettsiales bacterium]|nr:MAG: type II CRISPR RNA-guided endonuclease Cas9 [Rickettsiales bacterium]
MTRILGLDLGIASIGWSLVDIDKDINYIDAGVRIFDSAENTKDKKSSAEPRRMARLARRRLKRRRIRIAKIKDICKEFLKVNTNILYNGSLKDVWELRKNALERTLTPQELARVLIHITKHRGWKSNRKSEEDKDDAGKMKKAIIELEAKLDNLTAGAYYGAMGRNTKIKNTTGKYDHSIGRDTNKKEIEVIFEKQNIKDENFKNAVLECFDFQKEIQSMLGMVGNCEFEPEEKRAPKESYSAEIFNVYTKLNNLIRQNKIEFEQTKFDNCVKLFTTQKDVKFKHIKEKLELSDDFKFDGLRYNEREYIKADGEKVSKYLKIKNPEDKTFYIMNGYHKIKHITDNHTYIDTIYQALCYEKSDEKSKQYMIDNGIPNDIAEKALSISSNNFIHISIKAIRKLLPSLKKGQLYNDACKNAGYDKSVQNKGLTKLPIPVGDYLPKNPVVKRTISQTRKIVNAIVQKYGLIDQINIEFTRELGKSADERNKIEKRQKDNEAEKIINKEEVRNILNKEPTNIQCIKYRMYKQQDCKSLYSMKPIDLTQLLNDDKYCEIDHIIPYSKTFDDSLNNKCLVLASDNQNKGNKTPFEYLKDRVDWENWKQQIWAIGTLSYAKRKNLTCEEPNYDKWKSRNLNDTSYLSKLVKRYLEENLKFKDNDNIKNKVQVRPGILTANLRHQLGIEKIRSDGDTHHGIDASIIAIATQKMCQQISTWNANKRQDVLSTIKEKEEELKYTKDEDEIKAIEEQIEKMKSNKGVVNFSEELKQSIREQIKEKIGSLIKTDNLSDLSKIKIVSRMPRRGVTGEVHKQTINKSSKFTDEQKEAKFKIRKGIADNGDMPRVDIYKKGDKYYGVPVFVGDFVKELPTKTFNGDEMEEKDFCFSLWKDEPIYIRTKKKECFG